VSTRTGVCKTGAAVAAIIKKMKNLLPYVHIGVSSLKTFSFNRNRFGGKI
jgi:hypothetical protein